MHFWPVINAQTYHFLHQICAVVAILGNV